jgi:hypothetical protein
MPRALLSQRTTSRLSDASGIDQTQAAIALSALFSRRERLPSRAMQCTIGVKHKVASREAASFERQGYLGSCIAREGSSELRGRLKGLSELGAIQQGIVFAAHHEGEARQVREDGPGAILSLPDTFY